MHTPLRRSLELAALLGLALVAGAAASAPLPVTDLRINHAGASVALAWTHADNAVVRYEVWRSSQSYGVPGSANTARLADVVPGALNAEVTHFDPASSPINLYVNSSYFVRGVNADGEAAPLSNRTGEFDFKLGDPPYKAYGLNFSPYMDGQSPALGTIISGDQLRRRMGLIAPYTSWIRTFGMNSGLEVAGRAAREMGLKTALGAWLGSDTSANASEVSRLIAAAQAGEADVAVVGGEVLLRGDLTEAQLVGYINQVKVAVPPGVLVTTNDVWDELIAHPAVIAASDVVLANYYPYWLGIPLEKSVAALDDWYQLTVSAAGGKPVIVGETGWPSCGNTIYQAVPTPENASLYFRNFVSWARAKSVPYFYFEAFDESWKATSEGPQGACWGLWDKNGNMKPGTGSIFAGSTMADNWTGGPSMAFIYVPPIGSTGDLKGQVWHVNPAGYGVAVYIKVGGGWWTKPTFVNPLTPIPVSGSWTCDITTGGYDPQATEIAAYLVPNSYFPPRMEGQSSLPPELDQIAIAKTTVVRTP